MTPTTQLGRRICVIGTSGSGKTYVAQAIASKLGYRYVSNDALIWGPNWTEVPRDARVPAFAAALEGDDWTIDGNIVSGAEDEVMLRRCDTLVWLDLPRREVFSQVFFRTLRRLITRERLWHGNIERWRMAISPHDSIVMWSVRTFRRLRSHYDALFVSEATANKAKVRLRSRSDVDDWLAALSRR